ncbi:High-affinity branched-chain amino acid transport system permease protein LivH (TC 3.A.1.4.1) [hydrothermal vent metagenome]|uniref:High-affinity branched-chain amino acid transport system permease protein LivH (TC 3.A.1.4.1) n=1 Tax=hydrothermal vent metagenome TaxID=652676 RepID=A0A3B0S240_9ZZZZ
MLELILQTGVNAMTAASFAALMAVGLVLIFGVMQVVNFAHGELYMVGAYIVWYLYAVTSWPFAVAVAAGVVGVSAIGIFMERFMFRPMRGNPLGGLIMSVGMLFILQVGAVAVGGVGRSKQVPSAIHGSFNLFGIEGVTVPYQRLIVIISSVIILTLLWLFLKKTRTGWALRACAQDAEAAALQGISINRYSMIAVALGTGLAGLAGGLMAPLVPVVPLMGHSVIITAFIVIIVGGIGSLEGAVLAAVIYSFFNTIVTTFADGVIASILGLLLMMMVLIIRPTGIFGTAEKV